MMIAVFFALLSLAGGKLVRTTRDNRLASESMALLETGEFELDLSFGEGESLETEAVGSEDDGHDSVAPRRTRRGGVVPGCEYIAVDDTTVMALWVEDKRRLPDSLGADEVVFKCRDGYSTDGLAPFGTPGLDNMHVHVPCTSRASSGTRRIASCKPVKCKWDPSHPLFNGADNDGVFDAEVYRVVTPQAVSYGPDGQRRFHDAKWAWVPLMSGAVLSSDHAPELYNWIHEHLELSGSGQVVSGAGAWSMPQSPDEMISFGLSLDQAEAESDSDPALAQLAVEIQGLERTHELKYRLLSVSPCPPQQKYCLTHYPYQTKQDLRRMIFACEQLHAKMRAVVDSWTSKVGIEARLGHGTHLKLSVKASKDYSFDGRHMVPHMRTIVLYCDATGGLPEGVWYVDKVTTKAVLPHEAHEVAAEMAPTFEPEHAEDCEAFAGLSKDHKPVKTSGCREFKRVHELCKDGSEIPAPALADFDDMRSYCASRGGVKEVLRPERVEVLVQSVHAFPVVCHLVKNPSSDAALAVLTPEPCPEDGTYPELLEMDDAERAAELERLAAQGHPCGLRGWGGLELTPGGLLAPVPLHHASRLHCANGYALNGADTLALGADGALAAPVTDLALSCELDEYGRAVARQGHFAEQNFQGEFVHAPTEQCVPIRCLAPPDMLNHATFEATQREFSAECEQSGTAWFSQGCDVRIQCTEGHSFPSLTETGDLKYEWTAHCKALDRKMEPPHGCTEIQCTDDRVNTHSAGGELDRLHTLVGEHTDEARAETLGYGDEYQIPCDEGFTTDGEPYRSDNRAFVLECHARKDHEELAMRLPHLECVNCHHVQSSSDLSEAECHPVTCEAPTATASLEVDYHADLAVELNEFTQGGIETVPYKTQVSVRCAVGYELYRDGRLVEGGGVHEYLTLGYCQADGRFGMDPDLLHGLREEEEGVALGTAQYHCEKKPTFCPPLWEAMSETEFAKNREPFEFTNNIGISDGLEYDTDNDAAEFQKLHGSFTFTCDLAHFVGDTRQAQLDCEMFDCREISEQAITVTCVEEPGNRVNGHYVFGAPFAEVAFHHGEGPLSMCVPQVCHLPAALNPGAEHVRSTAVPRVGTGPVSDDYSHHTPQQLLLGEQAYFACGAEHQLVEREIMIDSHVADQKCMKDDNAGGQVQLTCGTGWLRTYEGAHDPACYDHCGGVFEGRDSLAPFLTSVCATGGGLAECGDHLARAYECDQGGRCRDNARISCAAVQRMQDLGGQPGVGVIVGRPLEAHAFDLVCEPREEGAAAGFRFQKRSERSGLKHGLDEASAYAQLLRTCGKQLRIVQESERRQVADVCPFDDLVEVRTDASGQAYSRQHAQARGLDFDALRDAGELCMPNRDDPTPAPGKCLEAVLKRDGSGDLVVTDCDPVKVEQRFVYTSESADRHVGASGQLVSLLPPGKGADGSQHLWCVQMAEKRDGDPKTTFMDYSIAPCAKDHAEAEELYCSGEPEHLPNCQTFRSNQHQFDAGASEDEDAFFFDSFEAEPSPPANIFSYVQPMTFTVEIQGEWAEIGAKLEQPFEVTGDDATKEPVMHRGRRTGMHQYQASAVTLQGMTALFKSIHATAKILDFVLFEGKKSGARITFDLRVHDHASFDSEAFLAALKAKGLEHRYKKFPTVACGENERCGFLYFRPEATVYDLAGGKTGKAIYDCTAEDPCKYEMMFEAPNPHGKQRVPHHTYHLCYSNDLHDCRRESVASPPLVA